MTGKKKMIIAAIAVVVLAAAGVALWLLLRGGSGSEGGVYVQPVSDVNAAGTGLDVYKRQP